MYKLLIEWLRFKLNIPEQEYICESCEILRHENELLRIERDKLLDHILNPSVIAVDSESDEEYDKNIKDKVKLPRNIPWRVRRQELERESREKARLEKLSPKPTDSGNSTIEELESNIVNAKVDDFEVTTDESKTA